MSIADSMYIHKRHGQPGLEDFEGFAHLRLSMRGFYLGIFSC
jgi:hypothetical protein